MRVNLTLLSRHITYEGDQISETQKELTPPVRVHFQWRAAPSTAGDDHAKDALARRLEFDAWVAALKAAVRARPKR